jgi:hypothetical protein
MQARVNLAAKWEEASITAATRRARNNLINMIKINTETRSSTSIPAQRDHIIKAVHLSARTLLRSLLDRQDHTDSILRRRLREHHTEKKSKLKSKNLDHSRCNRHLSNSRTKVTLRMPFISFIRTASGRLSVLRVHLSKRK